MPKVGILIAVTFLAAQVSPAAAHATFHEISIREVYAGSLLVPDSQYVELQMWASGQELVGGHALKSYDATGKAIGTSTFVQNVPNGANQSTILLATPAAESEFAVTADTALTGKFDPAGGAVCWEAIDCVSWGGFSGSLLSPAGSPAAEMPSGMALRRTISPLCPTALDAADDRDNSAADFSVVFPAPRPNSVAPSEHRCTMDSGQSGSGGPGPGGHRGKAPQTTLRRKPGKRIQDRTPTFRFASDEPGSTFECKLDRKPFRACRSPFTTKRLSFGPHTFKVRARDDAGHRDPSPTSYGFKVVPRT